MKHRKKEKIDISNLRCINLGGLMHMLTSGNTCTHTCELARELAACCLSMQALVRSLLAARGVCSGHVQPIVGLQLKNMARMLILATAKQLNMKLSGIFYSNAALSSKNSGSHMIFLNSSSFSI